MNQQIIALVVYTTAALGAAPEDPSRLPSPDATQLTFNLVRNARVSNELKLTEAQLDKIAQIENFVRQSGQGVGSDRQLELFRDAGKKLVEVLSDQQQLRMRQLILQGFGPAALRLPAVAKQIELTPTQTGRINDELESWRSRRREFSLVRRGDQPSPEVLEKLELMRKEAGKIVFGLLSEKQRAAYNQMIGDRFVFSKANVSPATNDSGQ